jgi:hypothetical protein
METTAMMHILGTDMVDKRRDKDHYPTIHTDRALCFGGAQLPKWRASMKTSVDRQFLGGNTSYYTLKLCTV